MEVRELMIKLLILNENNNRFDIVTYGNRMIDLQPTSQLEFMLELERQLDAYNKTLNEETPSALEPVCPSIVLGTLLNSNSIIDASTVVNLMHSNTHVGDEVGKHILKILLSELNANNLINRRDERGRVTVFRFGLIAMECMSTYVKASDAYLNGMVNSFALKGMILFELWRLYNVGYLHGDPHFGNFLFDPNYRYFNGRLGRIIVIDFGYSFKHGFSKLAVENIADIVRITSSVDGPGMEDGRMANHPSYKWLKLKLSEQEKMPTLLKKLHAQREQCKDLFFRHVLFADVKESSVSTVGGGPVIHPVEIDKFSEVDPNNIFTSDFISRYVEKEMVESANLIALGVTTTQRKTKKTKRRKGRTEKGTRQNK
jgi:hypothetical protein